MGGRLPEALSENREVTTDRAFELERGGVKPGREMARHFRQVEESSCLLLARDEVTWLRERYVAPDRTVEVFLSLGCGVQGLPHVMQDSVSVLEALGVSFAAGGGRQFCCANPYRGTASVPGLPDQADRLTAASVDRMLAWGARSVVHWCTACQITFGAWSRGEQTVWTGSGVQPLASPPRESGEAFGNINIYEFLADRLRAMGSAVPWKRGFSARILVEGHPELTATHDGARSSLANLLALIPGVEVVSYVDPPARFYSKGRNCTNLLTELTSEDVARYRAELAAQARARGADTVACQHHNCHRTWRRFSSDELAVRQGVSILAAALGVAHPDRYQTAAKLGDPAAVVAHTRPLWRSWGLEEPEAEEIAKRLFDVKYAAKPACACGGDTSKCTEDLITLGRIS
ncbi:MAG: hypothetical protein FJ034_04820 [Chloroflexi bacterium]|nr:hypothetical protein [Chloroflexota bacterium]